MKAAPALVLAAILMASPHGAGQGFRLTHQEYPVVNGSTSTHPLGVLIAGRVTGTSVRWYGEGPGVGAGGTRALGFTSEPYDPNRKLALGDGPAPAGPMDFNAMVKDSPTAELFLRTAHSGTSQSFEKLATREAELLLTARGPTPEEREAIRKSGAEAVLVPVARDAFVFLRHSTNAVSSLTLEQVRDIYAGALQNWTAVGGADRSITAYQREATSGSQVEMEQVMKGRPMLNGPDIRMTFSMFGPFNAIRTDQGGIGYSYHYYARFMLAVPEVAMLAIGGVQPHPSTIANGRYPLVTDVYLVHRSDLKAGSPAARLRDWLLSPAGQAIVAESGYVPLRR